MFGEGGTRDAGLLTVDNPFENPARNTYKCTKINFNETRMGTKGSQRPCCSAKVG